MEFRKLTLTDIDLILNMEGDFRENFIEKEHAKHFLINPLNWIFACINNKRIIAFLYGYELNRLNNQNNMLYIHEVGVLPEYQRQGIGTRMLNELNNICKYLGITRYFLFTQKSNIGACKLYEKIGGEKTRYGNDDDRTYFIQIK
jgi:ribosomal protein S18 acetylase RimI-like enzyme